MQQPCIGIGLDPLLVAPGLAAGGAAEGAGTPSFRLRRSPLPAGEVLALGADPPLAARTPQHDAAFGRAVRILLPRPALFGAKRALHVDPLACPVRPGPG